MAVPDNVLQSLHTMDGYDQMLAMDKIAREQGVGVEQLQAELQAFIQRGATPIPEVPSPQENDMDGFLIPGEAAGQSGKSDQQFVATSPRYIDDPNKLRMRYDPSVEGGERQSKQAGPRSSRRSDPDGRRRSRGPKKRRSGRGGGRGRRGRR